MANRTILKTVCMYCKTTIGEKDGKGVEGESAAICGKCWKEQVPNIPYPGIENTCEECGHTGKAVHKWPTFKDGKSVMTYQCDQVEGCLTRKHEVIEKTCACGIKYNYFKGGYAPSSCGRFNCEHSHQHPNIIKGK